MAESIRGLRRAAAPLGEAEERRAIAAALKALEDIPSGGGPRRLRALWAEVRVEKPANPEAPPRRLVAVVIVDYDRRQTAEVTVDSRGRVLGWRDVEFRPPFADDELEEARQLARRDRRVARLVQRGGAFDGQFMPNTIGDERPRLVGLRYAIDEPGQPFEPLARVVVDLSRGTVVSVALTSRRG
jgi:hypothetical protein